MALGDSAIETSISYMSLWKDTRIGVLMRQDEIRFGVFMFVFRCDFARFRHVFGWTHHIFGRDATLKTRHDATSLTESLTIGNIFLCFDHMALSL